MHRSAPLPSSTLQAPSAVPCVACESRQTESLPAVNGFPLRLCTQCGLRFVPPETLIAVDYDTLYKEQGDYRSHMEEARLIRSGAVPSFPSARRAAIEQIKTDQPRTLLEVGCGVGSFLAAIQRLGIETYGVEPSGNALQAGRSYLQCALHHGTLSDDAFPGQRFDAICFWEVLEHIIQARAFLSTVRDRLNPGGAVYLSTPNYGSRWMWNDVPRDPRSRPPVHVTYWTRSSLQELLQSVGFVGVEVRTMSYPANSGTRSGLWLGKYRACLDAALRPEQRKTLYARARAPG